MRYWLIKTTTLIFKPLILLVIHLMLMNLALAQNYNKIDSLNAMFYTETKDSNKIKQLQLLGNEYKNLVQDSALFFYKKALGISENIKSDKFTSMCLFNIATVYYYQNLYKQAINYYLKSAELKKILNDKKGLSRCYNNIGLAYQSHGTSDKAISYYLKSLTIDEELGDKEGIAICYNNIGLIYQEQGSSDKALSYYLKARNINEENNYESGLSDCYTNIGIIYFEKEEFDKTISYFLKALKINKEVGDEKEISASYNNLAIIYQNQKDYDKAISYYLKSLKIDKKYGDKHGISLLYGNIAVLNITIVDSTHLSEKEEIDYLNKVVYYAKKSYKIATEIDVLPLQQEASFTLMNAYTKSGDYEKAVKFAKINMTVKDSMFNDEKTKELANIEAKYKYDKKKIIDDVNTEKIIAIEKEQQEKQKIISFSIAGVLVLVVLFLIFVFIRLRITRRQKKKIEIQKQEISGKNSELSFLVEEVTSQRDEISTQRDTVLDQKNLIEKINFEVSQSINYAMRLQQSILPEKDFLSNHLSEYLLLFIPKDKVSGDFYWWTHINNHTIITAADSTGHGVPGAFMSILGISFLREIVSNKHITTSGMVLNELRKEMIKMLRQKGEIGEQKDGMDMALISINHETNRLQYSGANNPLYLVKHSSNSKFNDDIFISVNKSIKLYEIESSNYKLFEIKADKMPIAIYNIMDDFTTTEIQLSKGDQLYMFSDGFVDQFGGPKGKKFKHQMFKDLLLKNAHKPMKDQQNVLNNTYQNWKGDLEQVDDVIILGVKI